MALISLQKITLAVMIACALFSPTTSAEGVFYNQQGVLQIGTNEALSVNVLAGPVAREDVVSYPLASYIAVHFDGFNLPEGDRVIVRSPDYSVVHTYTGRGRDERSNFVASFVPGSVAIVQYIPNSQQEGAINTAGHGYTIAGFSRGFANKQVESVCGSDNTVPAKCFLPSQNGSFAKSLPLAYEKSQAVARLLINGTAFCTGWLAGSEGHLITNQHCISDPALASVTDFEFGAESSSCEDECKKQLGCKGTIVSTTSTFITNSEERDYALVKLPNTANLSVYKYLQLRGDGPQLNEEIYIPQHPRGWSKRISSVLDGDEPAFVQTLHGTTVCGTNQVGYAADTQGGSSGSPVLAKADNHVVALHHCGGCENNAVDIRDVIADLQQKSIFVKDLIVPATTPVPTTQAPIPTPAPVATPSKFCGVHRTPGACKLWLFWCKWDNTLCQPLH